MFESIYFCTFQDVAPHRMDAEQAAVVNLSPAPHLHLSSLSTLDPPSYLENVITHREASEGKEGREQ